MMPRNFAMSAAVKPHSSANASIFFMSGLYYIPNIRLMGMIASK